MLISEPTYITIFVPPLAPAPPPDDPEQYDGWLVLLDKYGNEIKKELQVVEDYWNGGYYYLLEELGCYLDLKTYSVIDYYTETPPYKDVLFYVILNGVRYGPETPNFNPTSNYEEYDEFAGTEAYFTEISPQEDNYFTLPAGFGFDYVRVKDGQLVIGQYPATGNPSVTWTNIVFTDKYGNNVEYRLNGVSEFDLDPERFGTAIYDGYVPFHFTNYTIDDWSGHSSPTSSYGAETDGTMAELGVPYAQSLRLGSNNYLLPVGFTYKLGIFSGNYLYALQLGPVQTGEITVNLPAGTDLSAYASMQLVLTSTDGTRKKEITVTDQMSYEFHYLARDKTWNVSLVNEYGDVFGTIENITIGDENVSVTFDRLLKAYTVTLTIIHPSGADVTDMASISWQGDGMGDYYGLGYYEGVKGSSVSGLPLGKELYCSFWLPDEISSTCLHEEFYFQHVVNDTDNNIVYQLKPISDDVALSYTDETTSFTVDKANILVDNYLTFRGQVGFKDEYANLVNNLKWIIDLPSSCRLFENSVLVGDEISNYSVDENQVTIPLSHLSDVVRFCAVPSEPGKYAANAYFQFDMNGQTITIPIGSARFCAYNMSLIVPQLTGNKSIVVRGTATNGKTVRVYDGEVQIAQTSCLANGSWHVTCNLDQAVSPSVHQIHAVVETMDGLEFSTDFKNVMYMECAPQVEWIKMLCGDYLLVFDYVNGTVYPPNYTYDPNFTQFTFIVKFLASASSIRNLKFKILDTSGHVTVVDGVYDVAEGVWVCTASFPSSDQVPLTVGVVYDYVWETETGHYEIIFTDYTNSVTPNAVPKFDPSGYVYEAVPSNRLQGVTTTCYYKDSENGEPVVWDAAQYEQENPLITDEHGYYRWDVPIGIWQVKYEKEGYETTYSDWLPVPPPQLDVNIAMTELRKPEVIKAHAYSNAVELEFSKYMKPETLTTGNITVSVNGTPVGGTIQLLNEELNTTGGQSYASRLRFVANQPFNASKVTLRVSHNVENYAGLQMNDDYVKVLDVESEMEQIVVKATLDVAWNENHELVVSVLPASAAQGKTLTVRNSSPMIISTDAETYTLDENGQAVVKVHGALPGMASLHFGVEDYDLTATTLVNVKIESDAGLKGDVNGDGEVNIADVNAVIDVTLGGHVDTETRKRADVNKDGEINIADINSVIDIILNPANHSKTIVNCYDLLHIDNVTMKSGDVCNVGVTLDNAMRYSALQCDIVLPSGMTLVDVHAADANVSKSSQLNGSSSRTVTYSMDKLPFGCDSQPVLTFTVRADASLAPESEITLTNVVLADGENNAWRVADISAMVNSASGVNELTAGADRVWVENNTLCIDSRQGSMARIVSVNGVANDLKVKEGITRQELDHGFYVVVVNGRSYKIAIK